GGIIVSTVGQADQGKAAKTGARAVNIVMKRSSEELAEIAKLVDQGIVKPRMDKVLPIDEARRAHDLNQTGKTHGKVVLRVA
ncbi:MAG TPA: zinc-binding dehydrogenase, partial [Candidatus Limnocylindrales bacterium]|nr:zinc-binding dehydrogenase [Candidatus Limnocylindrales bacterium]